MVPLADWNIYIPVAIDSDIEAILPYPSLESAGILTAYRTAVTPVLQAEEQGVGLRWNVAFVSSPTAGLSLSLTAPFEPSISRKADRLVTHIGEVLESARVELFASVGLKLARDAERIESSLPSSSAGSDSPSDNSQPERLDEFSNNLDQARENLHKQLLELEGKLARLESDTGVKPAPKKPGRSSRSAPLRTSSRNRSAGSDKGDVPSSMDSDAISRQLRSQAAQIRQEIEQIDHAKRELTAKKHAAKAMQKGMLQKKTELEHIIDQNKALTRLFESGYARPELARQTRRFPSLILSGWFMARPLGLFVGPALVWVMIRKRKKHAKKSVSSDEIPALGSIPTLQPEMLEDMLRPGCFAASAPREALAINRIASELFKKATAKGCRTIAFVGSRDGCGTSVSAALITAALANDRKRPVLIDLHWRRPTQHKLWWIPWAAGTVNWLRSKEVPAGISRGNPAENAHAIVIPAGPLPPFPEEALKEAPWSLWIPNFPARPAEFLFADLGNFEDTPELVNNLVASFDGFVLVSDKETSDQAGRAASALTSSGKTFLGFLYSDLKFLYSDGVSTAR